MGTLTTIEWTDHTFNAWIGCEKVSPACDHCYAERGSARLGAQHGLALWGGDRYFTRPSYWLDPLRWNRAAEKAGVRARVFTNSYGDVFEDRTDLAVKRIEIRRLIAATPWLDWLLLTKRIEHADRLMALASEGIPGPVWPDNVWLGTTVEDQERANARILGLVKVPARVRFLSCEPLLERVNLGLFGTLPRDVAPRYTLTLERIDWVIAGGESGGKARGFAFEWAADLAAQCHQADVAFFLKQAGDRPTRGGELVQLRAKKGGDLLELPPALRVRQYPRAALSREASP